MSTLEHRQYLSLKDVEKQQLLQNPLQGKKQNKITPTTNCNHERALTIFFSILF